MFEVERPWRDHARQFRVAEVLEQAPDVAIDRFLRDLFTGTKMPGDDGRLDATIERRSVKREQATFDVAEDDDRRMILFARQPIDPSEDFLQFVANDVASHLVSLAINKLAVRLIGPTIDSGFTRMSVLSVDKGGNEDASAGVGEVAADLGCGREPGDQANEHFRSLVRVGNHDDACLGFILRLQQQPFCTQPRQDGPANVVDPKSLGLDHERGKVGRGHECKLRR